MDENTTATHKFVGPLRWMREDRPNCYLLCGDYCGAFAMYVELDEDTGQWHASQLNDGGNVSFESRHGTLEEAQAMALVHVRLDQ
jgi:hypothetical protein